MPATGNFLTNSITKLELLCSGKEIGVATGFFLKQASEWFLATNWHVLAGRDPENGQPRHSSGAVPDQCRFHASLKHEQSLVRVPIVHSLGDALGESSRWYQHPTAGQDVDVAVLPIAAQEIGIAKDLMDPSGHDPDMLIDLGGELFLPGYPLGLSADGLMPIWKRASLASSLEFGHGMNRFFYVDTATREGMSGSPCLAVSNWQHYSVDRATNKVRVVKRPLSWRFLGIYCGRKNPSDSFEAQIGIVWRENLLYEAIAGKVPGSIRLEPKR
jgi:hypothetical protein